MSEVEHPADADESPFKTGRLVLSSTGNLHLFPSATFYCPAHVIPEWRHALDSFLIRSTPLPGYLASYLPFPMAEEHHQLLVDLAFDCLLCFGPNPFKSKFILAMNQDPDTRGHYFSPLFHLCVLGIGWRYCTDRTVVQMYYPNTPKDNRGSAYMEKARHMLLEDSAAPELSTVLALFTLTLYYVGEIKDPLAGCCFMMGQYICMDLRLHRRCDPQLAELGQEPNSELDIARRDVWGFALNFSAWWATFYAQPALPLLSSADQRTPFVHPQQAGRDEHLISLMASHHSKLSSFGLKSLETNHMVRAPIAIRVQRLREVFRRLLKWKEGLPAEIKWPPLAAEAPMHPGIIVTHGMYATYMILLFRPYIIELGGRRSLVPEALERCVESARQIVDQSRYLAENHGICRAPLSWQHTAYVCGTMLVLQASGLPDVTAQEREDALASLGMLQTLLDEFGQIWEAARKTAESLRQLQAECNPEAAQTYGSMDGSNDISQPAEFMP
nr:uncharacterized protein I303_00842 [Kwoniella dejecticola CBS 10117]OBR89020.1 hypothetical protein I303_00842 [Kwoniella dejecticola CBS 10117]